VAPLLLMTKEELKQFLKDNLRLEIEQRCKGHMCPDETWLIVSFDNEIVDSIKIRHEECPGEWGE
jgi:predicted acetyltransferase